MQIIVTYYEQLLSSEKDHGQNPEWSTKKIRMIRMISEKDQILIWS